MKSALATVVPLLALLLAGCGDGAAAQPEAGTSQPPAPSTPSASPSRTRPPVAERCSSEILRKADLREVEVTSEDGTRLFGVELGSGPRGVVLMPTSSGDLCGWAPQMVWLARDGFHVLAMDARCGRGYSGCESGHGMDTDVVAAAKALRSRGAETVVAVGASEGGSVVLAAAAREDHGLDAVVDLSGGLPARYYTGASPSEKATELAARIDVPVMYASARDDADFPAPRHRKLFRATRVEDKKLVRLREGGHGESMLGVEERSRFYRTRLVPFLRRYSAGRSG